MIKSKSILESIVEGRVSHWHVDADCPLAVAKEMLYQFQKYIGQIEDAVKAQQEKEAAEKAAAEEKPVEEVKS